MNLKLVDKSEVEGIRCKEVSHKFISHHESHVVPEMRRILFDKNGLGLAAPQVGIKRSFFIFRYGAIIVSCYNPTWKPKGNKQIMSIEGCLSYPHGHKGSQLRHKLIFAEFVDCRGITQNWKLRGQDAIVFQHETDHLIGKTILYKGEKE